VITDNLHRETRQRKAILKALRSTASHPTADWIYAEVRKSLPNISKGTVYRNLKVLLEAGMISELRTDGDKIRFEGRRDNHCHFICLNCGEVLDLDEVLDESIARRVAQNTGLRILTHHLEFKGECRNCLKDGLEPKNGRPEAGS
jgi:Fe2+ or Zn2+ uptake regulation protein